MSEQMYKWDYNNHNNIPIWFHARGFSVYIKLSRIEI